MLVGTLADAGYGKVAFEYADEWMEKGFAISPFSLPLEKRVFISDKPYFGGLFGAFADSLPDAWGNILLNRMLKKNGLHPEEITEMEQMYRRMCFHVFAHNRDDHSKNFSFLYDEKEQEWKLSPAYDMTYSTTYYGEHTTTVNGNGRNPSEKDMITVGIRAGLSKKLCTDIVKVIKENVNKDLRDYLK